MNRTVTIDIGDIVNSTNGTKEEKEDYYLKMLNLDKSKFNVVWSEEDKIIGVSPLQQCNSIDVTVTVNPNGEISMKNNHYKEKQIGYDNS